LLFSDSPLFIACQKGNPAIVSLLCGSGFLINVINEYNRTPLWAAVSIQQHHTVDFLLSQPDSDVNIATLESYLGHQ
jgi:ankyrin repeat protein